jgi:hypothetical protein
VPVGGLTTCEACELEQITVGLSYRFMS